LLATGDEAQGCTAIGLAPRPARKEEILRQIDKLNLKTKQTRMEKIDQKAKQRQIDKLDL
jgi:hypothetical protein